MMATLLAHLCRDAPRRVILQHVCHEALEEGEEEEGER